MIPVTCPHFLKQTELSFGFCWQEKLRLDSTMDTCRLAQCVCFFFWDYWSYNMFFLEFFGVVVGTSSENLTA